MARGTPLYTSGTLPTRIAGGQVTEIRALIETVLQSYQSNATTAWETYDTIDATAANLDRVYLSVGDRTLASGAGDARLFIRIDKYGPDDIDFKAYQDWSDLSSTGSNEAFLASNCRWSNVNDFSECRYFSMVNEYEFLFFIIQDNLWHSVHFGSPIRAHIPSNYRGIAFTTASATAGSSVTVNLDRDITATIQDNLSSTGSQKIWIYNQTPTSTALRSATIEIADVETIAAGSITFASLSNNFDSGAIVGLDPCPMFITAYNNIAFTTALNATLQFTNSVAGTWSAPSTQIADYELSGSTVIVPAAAPGYNGDLYGCRALIVADQSGLGGFRGVSEMIAFVRSGSMLSGDFWRPNGVTANQYKVFPFMTLSGYTGWVFAIGPGAT